MEVPKRKVNASWRDDLPIHPAADRFPLLPPDEQRAFVTDIEKTGLAVPIVLWRADKTAPVCLLDGRNRLDAIEAFTGCQVQVVEEHVRGSNLIIWCIRAGAWVRDDRVVVLDGSVDPYIYVISANICRRHLNTEERKKILLEFIARTPEKSDRQIAKEIGVDHKTIGRARAKGEDVGRIPHVSTRIDSQGRQQPARRARARGVTTTAETIVPPAPGDQSPRQDIGSDSADEIARKDACIEELENKAQRPERENIALRSEVEEAKVVSKLEGEGEDEDEGFEFVILLKAWDRASRGAREKFKARVGLYDKLDIPPYLDRRASAS
jgi:hypothetical protein